MLTAFSNERAFVLVVFLSLLLGVRIFCSYSFHKIHPKLMPTSQKLPLFCSLGPKLRPGANECAPLAHWARWHTRTGPQSAATIRDKGRRKRPASQPASRRRITERENNKSSDTNNHHHHHHFAPMITRVPFFSPSTQSSPSVCLSVCLSVFGGETGRLEHDP